MNFKALAETLGKSALAMPKYWDGKAAILEMKAAGYPQWKQMEWIGFYFQFLCGKHLAPTMQIPGPKYGNVQFDGFLQIPWDFKAHAINTSSHEIIVNDALAISQGIQEHTCIGVILALGKVEYNDEDRSFQQWHNSIKGGLSAYEINRIQRGAWSRLRKVSFDLQQISFIKITDATLVKCGSFQQGFRNAKDNPRKAKVLLNLEQLDEEIVHLVEF